MKAFLMCAGRGERLRPLTYTEPKCLLPIAGKPMLEWWIDNLYRWGFTDVFINISHLPQRMFAHLMDKKYSINVSVGLEPIEMGTARTIYFHRDFVGEDPFFGVFYSDVWTQCDFSRMLEIQKLNPVATMGIQELQDVSSKGVVVLDGNSIVDFEEKPKHPKSHMVWAGLVLIRTEVLYCMTGSEKDIGKDLLPELIKMGEVKAHIIEEPLYDMGGSVGDYYRVNKLVEEG